MLLNSGMVETFQCCVVCPLEPPPPPVAHFPTFLSHSPPCVALVQCFSRDTLLDLSMVLTCLIGAKSLRHCLVSKLLGKWVASSHLARGRWVDSKEIANLPRIRNKQIEAVQQYVSLLFPGPELIGLLMDLSVPKLSFSTCRSSCVDGGPPTQPQRPLVPAANSHSGEVHGPAEGVGHPS